MDLQHCMPVLFVKNAKEARSFYEGILELTVTGDFGGMNIMFKEGFALWEIMEENIIPQILGSANIYNSTGTSRFELCFETENLDSIYATLKEKGIKFLHEINEELWGQRTIRFYDYDGHLIEVGEALPVFLKRIYTQEGKDIEATAKRCYVEPQVLKQILEL